MKSNLYFLRVWPMPPELSEEEHAQVMRKFGAVEVIHTKMRGKQHSIIAGFNTFSDCRFALSRIHQLELLGHRLKAVLFDSSREDSLLDTTSNLTCHLKQLQQCASELSICTAVSTFPPVLPYLRYQYPEPSPLVLHNMLCMLAAVPQLYTQVLHLMNKMHLPPPFGAAMTASPIARQAMLLGAGDGTVGGDDKAVLVDEPLGTYPKRTFLCSRCCRPSSDPMNFLDKPKNTHESFIEIDDINGTQPVDNNKEQIHSSSSESELESEPSETASSSEQDRLALKQWQALKRPRKHVAGVDSRKRAKLQLQQNKLIQETSSMKCSIHEDKKVDMQKAFGSLSGPLPVTKLQLRLPATVNVTRPPPVRSDTDEGLVETLQHGVSDPLDDTSEAAAEHCTAGKDERYASLPGSANFSDVTHGDLEVNTGFGKLEARKGRTESTVVSSKYISLEELEKNRIKESEYPVVPVLSSYSPGTPSPRLYIKNLARCTSEQHLRHIYDRYVHEQFGSDVAQQDKYHIRVLQEGRMKGQAFVTLPSTALAERARRDTNGYILHDRPMVVAFARARPGT